MRLAPLLLFSLGTGLALMHAAPSDDLARWKQRAENVTILRDTWGVPHVYGKTDADAVFGLLYAQAEDDFNRVELNYVNAMGRLAEIEGEAELYRDLRMKLFIDPADMQAKYAESPAWLSALMDAFAVVYFCRESLQGRADLLRIRQWLCWLSCWRPSSTAASGDSLRTS